MKKIKILMIILGLISLTVSAQLPEIQSGSIEPCFVSIMNSHVKILDSLTDPNPKYGDVLHPLKQGEEIFAYCEIEGKNTLIGKGVWVFDDKAIADTGCIFAVMLNDKGVTAPNQITGIEYGEKFKIGVVKDGFMIDLIPSKVYNSQMKKAELKAYSLELYRIEGITYGDTLKEINEVPYLIWLHAQKPTKGKDTLIVTKTFDLNKNDNIVKFIETKPKFMYNVKYDLVNSTSKVLPWDLGIQLSKGDFDKGVLTINVSGSDYYENPYVFTHTIKLINCKWIPINPRVTPPIPPKIEPQLEFYTPIEVPNMVYFDKYVTVSKDTKITIVKNRAGKDVEIIEQFLIFTNNTNKTLSISYIYPNKGKSGFTLKDHDIRTEKVFNGAQLKNYSGKLLIVKYQVLAVENGDVKFPDDKGEIGIIIK